MKSKKGFALATTLMAMVVIFALSSILIALVADQNKSTQKSVLRFEKKVQLSQIANNFVRLGVDEFVLMYQNEGYQKAQDAKKVVLKNQQLELWTEESLQNKKLWIVQDEFVLAKVEIVNSDVTYWSYLKENK